MNKICYVKDEIEKLEVLGKGDRSIVYKDPKYKKAIKIYKRGSICYLDDALRHMNNQKLASCNVIIPEGKVYINDKNVGFYSEVVHGYTIFQLTKLPNLPIKVTDFMRAYDQACENTIRLSQMGYNLWDLHEKNLMYDIDKKQIMFIDIDAWHKKRASKKLINRNLFDLECSINVEKVKKHLIQK